jgi:putative lipoic acid-binding regulatory protein
VQTVTAKKADQAIIFAVPVSTVTYNSTFTVSPTSSSGLLVTVKAEGACSISGGTVTMDSGTDTCKLTASQVGDTNYNSAPNEVRTVSKQKTDQRITFPAPASTAKFNSTFTVSPTSDSGLPVTVKAEGACSISGSNVTMTSGMGNCTLTASQAGDSNYALAINNNIVQTVTAKKADQAITFTQPASPAPYNSEFTVYPTSSSSLAVTVKAEGACSISSNKVTMNSGTDPCKLTAYQVGNNNYNRATDVVRTVAAQKASQTVTFNQPASPATYNSTFTVYPTSNSGLPVTVTSSGACSISGNTVSMTSGTGPCTLTASQAGDANYKTATTVVKTVNAQKASQTITFAAPASPATYNSKFTVYPTSSSGLTVTVTASGGCAISGNTVSMTSGTYACTLTASRASDSNYNSANNMVRTVTAQKANQSITFNKPASPATYNSKFTLYPTSSSGLAVTVTASGGCNISGNTVTMTSGTNSCNLQASRAGDANYNPATNVEQTVTAQKASQTITFNKPASPATYNSPPFTVSPTSNSNLPVNVNASGACTISDKTVTMTNGTGDCTLTASQDGDEKYNPATNVVRTVSAQKAVQAPLTVTGPSSITFGATGTVIYKGGSGSGRVLFNHGSSTGCIVDAFTGVIAVTNASGSCTVWVTKESDNNYLATSSAGFEIPMKRLPAP